MGTWKLVGNHWKLKLKRGWSALASIISRPITGIGHAGTALASDISATLDIDNISARLAIESRARADGQNEQPSSTEEMVTGTQGEIIVYFKQLQRNAHHQVAELADKLREIREILDLPEATSRLRDTPSRCENEIRRRTSEYLSQLSLLGERERHYTALRNSAALSQDGNRLRSPLFHYSLIALLIGVTAFVFINVATQEAADTALASVSWAVSISLIYIMVPYLLGAAVSRSVTNSRRARALSVWLASGLVIAFVGTLSFFAAHYVSALISDPGATVSSVLAAMQAAPTAIGTDAATWTGFAIVATAGLLPFCTGCRSADSYSGRSAIHRHLHRTRDEREFRTEQTRKRIYAIVDFAEDELTELLGRLKGQIRQYSQLVEDTKRIPENLGEYDIALEDACNIVLDRYRAVNGNARQTEWPISFSEHVCFRSEQGPVSSMVDDEESRLESLREGVAELEGEIPAIRQQLRDLNWSAISEMTGAPADSGSRRL
jgi:hypothetical protein